MAFSGRLYRRGARGTATCDNCMWITVSTGRKAEDRVLRLVLTHRCQSVPVTFRAAR